MLSRFHLAIATAYLAGACADHGVAPARPLPARMTVVTAPAAAAPVGSIAGTIKVRVSDANDTAISGVVVAFTISVGTGTLSRTIDTTKVDGTAETVYRLGTASAANEVTVMASGMAPLKFAVASVVGPPSKLTLSTRSIRMDLGRNNSLVGAVAGDEYGNNAGVPIAWVARDPALVSANPGPNNSVGIVVLRRPGQTYAVGTSGAASDSILITVPDASAPCAFSAAPVTLAIGGVVVSDIGAACIHAAGAGEEYAVISHYNTALTQLTSFGFNVTGNGVDAATSPFPNVAQAGDVDAAPQGDHSFELALRRREQRELPARAEAARTWYHARRAALSRQLREGDLVPLNVNANEFCSSPDTRPARVAAISQGAIIMADTANPPGGFTDEEYREFGVAMDTLVNPVDTAAFGSPSDIDGNGRVGILFTRAVNELTARGSTGGIVLGFFYSRDLLPRVNASGDCPGSNVSEMFYIMVPDPNGVVNSNARSKAFVQSIAMATVGHEYQHLINASRRMYINESPRVNEEVWLNEGLSHIAEELLFYRASGHLPRQNLDAAALAGGSTTRAMFDVYQRNNFARYREYLRNPETNSPLAEDDLLATRGAAWSFLRYLADRTRTTDGDFWRKLVNSRLTGTPNVDEALAASGLTTLSALRDWSASVVSDDIASGVAPPYQQPSWNFVTALPAVGLSFALVPRDLRDMLSVGVTLQSGASSYLRFTLAQDHDGHVDLTGNGGSPPAPGLRLTIVRIK